MHRHTGQYTREKNTGACRNADASISRPVGISRPVRGQRIMTAPIGQPRLRIVLQWMACR
jgi:hypothetical protein